MPTQQVTISIHAQETLLTDIYKRRCIEACGLLTGSIDDLGNWYIEQVHPLRNIFDSPVYFEFAPEDILAVELDYPGPVVGAYPIHPTGLAVGRSHNTRAITPGSPGPEDSIGRVYIIGPAFHSS